MSPEELAQFRLSLQQRRTRLLAEGAVPIEPARKDATDTKVDEDAAPLTEMNQALASGRNRVRAEELAQVESALRRLTEDPESYGLCAECEEAIAPARLQAMPHARLCVRCQARRDPARGAARRKITDYR